jgi:hypothetical protein
MANTTFPYLFRQEGYFSESLLICCLKSTSSKNNFHILPKFPPQINKFRKLKDLEVTNFITIMHYLEQISIF